MANENLKKQMVVKLGTTTNTEAQLISNMVDGALSGKGGNDPELENLKKQMVIKLGTTTNEDAQIISNMVDNAAGGGGDSDISIATAHIINNSSQNETLNVRVCWILDNPLPDISGCALPDVEVRPNNTRDVQVLLYKGKALTSYTYNGDESAVSISGDIEDLGLFLMAYGDFTITVN